MDGHCDSCPQGSWRLWKLGYTMSSLGSPAKRTCHLPKDSSSCGGCEPWPLPATHIPILGSPCHHLSCCKFGVIVCCLLAGSSRLVPHTASYEPLSAVLLFRIVPSPCLSQATDRLCPQVPHTCLQSYREVAALGWEQRWALTKLELAHLCWAQSFAEHWLCQPASTVRRKKWARDVGIHVT